MSEYKEDFRPRRPVLPPGYKTTGPPPTARKTEKLPKSRVKFTNVSKVLWPEEGFTKGDLIRYYDAVAATLLPHLKDRPLIMERYPNGIAGNYFLQKDMLPQHSPEWILPSIRKIHASAVDRDVQYLTGGTRDTILFLANYAAITLHPWSSRIAALEYSDFVLFDLDPVSAPFSRVRRVAMEVMSVLNELKLRSYAKTSGVSGIHIYLPLLERKFTHTEARIFAEVIASAVVQRIPGMATTHRSIHKRNQGMVYVDCLQNGRGKTLASVYSVRARPGAPVSTPLTWDELKKLNNPHKFTIRTVPTRLKRLGDLFQNVLKDGQDISPFLSALRRT